MHFYKILGVNHPLAWQILLTAWSWARMCILGPSPSAGALTPHSSPWVVYLAPHSLPRAEYLVPHSLPRAVYPAPHSLPWAEYPVPLTSPFYRGESRSPPFPSTGIWPESVWMVNRASIFPGNTSHRKCMWHKPENLRNFRIAVKEHKSI